MRKRRKSGTNYPILRTTSRVDGTPIQDFLDSMEGRPFGTQRTVSQDGLCICIDDHQGLSNWGRYASRRTKFNDFKFTGQDRPSYLPGGSHQTTYATAKTIVNEVGPLGEAFSGGGTLT